MSVFLEIDKKSYSPGEEVTATVFVKKNDGKKIPPESTVRYFAKVNHSDHFNFKSLEIMI